jgi:hypothetical protein
MARQLISMLAMVQCPGSAGAPELQPSLDMLLELFPDQSKRGSTVAAAKTRSVAAKMVLADGGELLLAALPAGSARSQEKLLISALVRMPMNQFGLWATMDGVDGMAGAGCYPAAAMLNHSCVPNVAHQLERKAIVFYAIHAIQAGQPLTHCYMPLEGCTRGANAGTQMRQEALGLTWCFRCTCSRCQHAGASKAKTAIVNAFDKAHLCGCGQFKLPAHCLRKAAIGPSAGKPGEVAVLSARWAKALNVPQASVCCCDVFNLRVWGEAGPRECAHTGY